MSGHHKAVDEQGSGLAIARYYGSSATSGSMWKCSEIFWNIKLSSTDNYYAW